MKTQIKKDGDTLVVSMDGKLDFGTHIPLREHLNKIADKAKTDEVPKKIIFDLENLDFVGSSGITSFVQALKDFNAATSATTNEKPRYCNVKSEFQRVIKAFDETSMFEIHETREHAKKSFDN